MNDYTVTNNQSLTTTIAGPIVCYDADMTMAMAPKTIVGRHMYVHLFCVSITDNWWALVLESELPASPRGACGNLHHNVSGW